MTAALVLLLGACAVMEMYTRLPQAVSLSPLQVPADTTQLVLVAHGSRDADNPQFQRLLQGLQRKYAGEEGVYIHYLRWTPWSDSRLRAAANAVVLGARIGAELARLPALQSLELIVHSSGAYLADALCEAYRRDAVVPARVHAVFLDAFQINGFLDWTHGARTHGRCTDFALSILNTNDPAPATNRPLRHAFNIDVTALPRPAGFSRNGHYWPVEYYVDSLPDQSALPTSPDHARYPRGAVFMGSE